MCSGSHHSEEKLAEAANRGRASALAEHGRDAIAAFNRQAARYKLMLVYPDGSDEAELMAPRAHR